MPDDPIRYWQDITENYRQMSDGELLELGEKPEDLTEVARQALSDEMHTRGLSASQPAFEPEVMDQRAVIHWGVRHDQDMEGQTGEDAVPREYTWKALLCQCENRDKAWQVGETLRLAGIESWITGAASRWDMIGPQVQVAADE